MQEQSEFYQGRPRDPYTPMLKRVRERELGIGRAEFRRRNARARFSSYRLEQQHDTHDPDAANLKLSFLRRRSKIVEIVAAGDVVFALTLSGVCAAFCGSRRIAFLNTMPDEVIRSLFYNKANRSLITVSVYRDDNFSSLKCRTTPIEYIRRGQPDAGFALFESECLKWPGFVEFDDVNGKVLTYSVLDKAYRVWDMTNYEELYVMREPEIAEIKISPGIMLVIYNRVADHVPLKVVNIEDGATLRQFNHPLHRTRKIDFIEQFNEKLLVKQENDALQIIDIRSGSRTEVASSQFMTPSAFIFLYENQLFLTFRQRNVSVWNFRGEKVTSFEDHTLWHPDCNTNNIYITSQQDLIISYCKCGDGVDEDGPDANLGSINVSNILNGKSLAKVRARAGHEDERAALEDVTALYYNEDSNEIYTGNNDGRVHIWSNLRSLPSAVRKPIPDKKLVGDRPVRISLPSPL